MDLPYFGIIGAGVSLGDNGGEGSRFEAGRSGGEARSPRDASVTVSIISMASLSGAFIKDILFQHLEGGLMEFGGGSGGLELVKCLVREFSELCERIVGSSGLSRASHEI